MSTLYRSDPEFGFVSPTDNESLQETVRSRGVPTEGVTTTDLSTTWTGPTPLTEAPTQLNDTDEIIFFNGV